jgi:hypothetical protein
MTPETPRQEQLAIAYNWLHFYYFGYNQFWDSLELPEFSWRREPNSILISTKDKQPHEIKDAVAAPCCVLHIWDYEFGEFWYPEPGMRMDADPSEYLLNNWVVTPASWIGSKGKKLTPASDLG